ncbi:transposase [Marichromatium gracile]|uniref:transposase n=1 Tax=Marichromatium gracile TaxID=1048 RepID=UPI001F3119D5|nr:transposase [Marichromatium gracile]MCF1183057.1 transposase [Marichromatium gracile]
MARLPRFVLPGYPQHVIQRGNNRQRILFEEDDYWFIWEKLKAATEKFQCSIHAYVLMPNHFHLLLTPHQDNGIGKLMQYVGRYYVQYFNARYERTGTLWEGRYRATLLDPKDYLLPVSLYIESNAVRAGLVDHPADYGWSSHGANALGEDDPLTTPHTEYNRLGRSMKARREHYARLAETPVGEPLLGRIRDSTNKAWVLGDDAFCTRIATALNRRPQPRPRGGDRRSAAYRRRAAAAAAMQ